MKLWLLAVCALGWAATTNAQAAYPICGNGTIEQGEFCDDGNTLDGDLCASNCLFGAPPYQERDPYQPYPNAYPSVMISPSRALGLSLASTILTGGAIPSLGHMYAGEYRRAIASWGLRTGAGVVLLTGAFVLIATSIEGNQNCGDFGVGCGGGAMLLGTGTIIGTWIFDVADAPGAAIRSNQQGKRPWQVGLAPSAMPALGGGLSLQLKF